jgi:endonuclease YncB( thermonuclease family)
MKCKFIAVFAVVLSTTAHAGQTISGPARIVDGDTVVVGDIHVRLKGVDAAELGTTLGDAAKAVMLSIVTGDLTIDRIASTMTLRVYDV